MIDVNTTRLKKDLKAMQLMLHLNLIILTKEI